MCNCIQITYQFTAEGLTNTIEVDAVGEYNGYNYFIWTVDAVTYTMWHDPFDNWNVTTDGLGGSALVASIKSTYAPCPIGAIPVWITGEYFSTFTTELCPPVELNCDCGITVTLNNPRENIFNVTALGLINDRPYYEFVYIPTAYEFRLYWDGLQWVIENTIDNTVFWSLDYNATCPIGVDWINQIENDWTALTEGTNCGCVPNEDRTQFQFNAIKLPPIFREQNRGIKDCCCEQLVLAGGGTETWQNDLTSAWIKLSAFDDTCQFILTKCGEPTIYEPTIVPFVNEPNAFYTTINWAEVIVSDGVGDYQLQIQFNISGVTGAFTWGKYKLDFYTIANALKTARVRAIFNGYHEIEGINFTGSNVESTHRFYGFIGNRQPNTEIDNIIYNNREMKRVIREHLNDYEIITDPENECIILPLVDLYLLSENELFISDYNAHNHSYRYLDLPVIVSESPTYEYKTLSRKAVLTCKVSDKFKNKRTYYNG
jgi:hypothetical protein